MGKVEVAVVDLPLITQLEFQQSFLFMILKVPQIQFIDRMVVNPVATQRMGTHSANCQIPQVRSSGLVVHVPVNTQRQAPAVHCRHGQTVQKTVEVSQVQFGCGRPCDHAATS